MKTLGILRPIDHCGRIVIPKEMREECSIYQGQRMILYSHKNQLLLQKLEDDSQPPIENCKRLGSGRPIDNLGRIVPPKEWRDQMEIKQGDKIEVYITDNLVTMQKYTDICIICGNKKDNLINLSKYTKICPTCLKNVHNKNIIHAS